jgi:hypothetical protein
MTQCAVRRGLGLVLAEPALGLAASFSGLPIRLRTASRILVRPFACMLSLRAAMMLMTSFGALRSDRDDSRVAMRLSEFLAFAWTAANDKARELGWLRPRLRPVPFHFSRRFRGAVSFLDAVSLRLQPMARFGPIISIAGWLGVVPTTS